MGYFLPEEGGWAGTERFIISRGSYELPEYSLHEHGIINYTNGPGDEAMDGESTWIGCYRFSLWYLLL